MNEELNLLKQPPRRPQVEEQVKKAEQRAYDSAYLKTKKEIAKVEGTAAGIASAKAEAAPEGAVEAARARALGQVEAPPKPAAPAAPPKPSGEFIETPEGRVPREFYDLSTADQQRYKELASEQQDQSKAESQFDRTSLALLDQLGLMSKRLMKLEKSDAEKATLIVGLTRMIDRMEGSLELQKSNALSEQMIEVSQLTVAMQAVGAEQQLNHERRVQEAADQALEHQARWEESERVLTDHEARLQTSGELYQERGNAVQSQLIAAETRQNKLDVSLQELEAKTDTWTDPITRSENRQMIDDLMREELQSQAPRWVNEAIDTIRREEFGPSYGSVLGQRIDPANAKMREAGF